MRNESLSVLDDIPFAKGFVCVLNRITAISETFMKSYTTDTFDAMRSIKNMFCMLIRESKSL